MREATREIPLSRPWITEREEELVLEVLRSGRLSLGPWIERFEEMAAERAGAPYAAAVSSGTGGLHLLCKIAGLGPGDEVITSPFSFVASANCFILEGATPVFVDVDPVTLNLDPTAIEAAITERTKAIVTVDIFGYPCELDQLAAIADSHELTLIEDSCEALGAEYRGRPLGAHGPSAVFAFYPNKQMTTGEGGVVTTHAEDVWQQLVSLRNQGRSYGEGGGWFHHVQVGLNYRWTDIQAAIGIAQLERFDAILALRAAAAERYQESLGDLERVEVPTPDDDDHRRSWFVYVVKLDPDLDREKVMLELRRQGVATAEYVPCIHLQPYMRDRYGFVPGLCPVAEDAASRTLALPFFTQIEPDEQDRVVEALRVAIAA
ncbi:MAG TPA: DegT/DnrJ/EryC1/StrS family aminotransferase [Gaiellaceae bacterium]|nr:DegT/DnrJ/EryC1/StrS family aminotransferase [Gaiellaceae bacterium]